ncbi:MAG: LysR family transcriptional regulator [Sphingomonadales bacterium]|nr:LysR family transcriptional regulator [Sphingomonadales bacterium]
MMIELRRLRYLVTLANRLSYARAAEDLGITQSALTRAIQSLEREMGLRLFDRDQSGVSLTEAGQRVVEKAETLLANAKDFEHQVKLTASLLEGRLRFGMTPVVMQALLPATIPARLQAAPAFVHEGLVRESEALWHLLTAREIEFFVSQDWEVPDTLPTRVDVLGEFPLSLAVRSDHPLLADPRSAQKFPVLISAYGSKAGQLPVPLSYAFPGGLHLFEDATTLSRLTQDSDAIWMTSAFAIAPELATGLLRELPWPAGDSPGSFRVAMYSLERRTLSPAALELRQAFRGRIQGQIKGERLDLCP